MVFTVEPGLYIPPQASEAPPAFHGIGVRIEDDVVITENGYDVTDDFVRYAHPLVGDGMVRLPMIDGRQQMTRLKPIHADQKLPAYLPQADRPS